MAFSTFLTVSQSSYFLILRGLLSEHWKDAIYLKSMLWLSCFMSSFSGCQQVPLLMFSWLTHCDFHLCFSSFQAPPALFFLVIIKKCSRPGCACSRGPGQHQYSSYSTSSHPVSERLPCSSQPNHPPTPARPVPSLPCLWAINLCLPPFPAFIWSVHRPTPGQLGLWAASLAGERSGWMRAKAFRQGGGELKHHGWHCFMHL